MKQKSNFILLLTLLFVGRHAVAFPKAPVDDLNFNPWSLSDSIEKLKEILNYNFTSIVKLSNCSGSLIQFKGQSSSSKAIVMTNGHCLGGFLQPGEVIVNKNVQRNFIVFDLLMQRNKLSAQKILYATMTDTDVALYELNESYDSILSRSAVPPLVLSNQKPTPGTAIDIVSGYWERGYSCAIDDIVPVLREDKWTFKNSLRYTAECKTIGGTSGSPILDRHSREVIAINNTGNEDGQRCTMNNPCEVNDRGEVSVRKGINYGQQTYNIYTCLNNEYQIDLTQPGCELPR